MAVVTDLWGQDIALDVEGQALVAANGELVLTEGPETGVQDVRLRLLTYLGELFYDEEFGSILRDWIYEESTPHSRAAFCAEAVMRVEMDQRVAPLSVDTRIVKWDERSLICEVSWRFVDEDQPYNLVMQVNKDTKELVVRDVKPRADSFSAHIKGY